MQSIKLFFSPFQKTETICKCRVAVKTINWLEYLFMLLVIAFLVCIRTVCLKSIFLISVILDCLCYSISANNKIGFDLPGSCGTEVWIKSPD